MELRWVAYKSVNTWTKYHHYDSSKPMTLCCTITTCGRTIYGDRVFTLRSNCPFSADLFCKQCEKILGREWDVLPVDYLQPEPGKVVAKL